jgi:hypothetical protein
MGEKGLPQPPAITPPSAEASIRRERAAPPAYRDLHAPYPSPTPATQALCAHKAAVMLSLFITLIRPLRHLQSPNPPNEQGACRTLSALPKAYIMMDHAPSPTL